MACRLAVLELSFDQSLTDDSVKRIFCVESERSAGKLLQSYALNINIMYRVATVNQMNSINFFYFNYCLINPNTDFLFFI